MSVGIGPSTIRAYLDKYGTANVPADPRIDGFPSMNGLLVARGSARGFTVSGTNARFGEYAGMAMECIGRAVGAGISHFAPS